MPNHIHLLLRQAKEEGIRKFMVKIGSGYGRYFNKKYQRKGYVFQNRFKDVHIEDDAQLFAIFNYIHANPISLIEPNFKEQGIKKHSQKEVKKFVESYKWSSYLDYISKPNFSSVTERVFLSEFMGGDQGCRESLSNWIRAKKGMAQHSNLFLE